jgi:DNA-directed RNA polymerase specialized sigma24 family protein
MDLPPASYSLAEVVARCRNERSKYRKRQISDSPLCIELFRRVFAGNQEAWVELCAAYDHLMRAWAGSQSVVDVEDVVQEAFISFYRSASRQPTLAAALVATDDLSPVLSYLRRCVKTALLMQVRKQRIPTAPLDLLPDVSAPGDISITTEQRMILHESIRGNLKSAKERIVFELFFRYEMKQQEILAQYPKHFGNVAEINTIVQRLTRRLRKDAGIQQLRADLIAPRQKSRSTASLEIRVNAGDQEHTPMDRHCGISEDQLLEYIMGRAAIEVCVAIEQSPACRSAAQDLAHELLPILQALYRSECPTAEALVIYQERRLSGAEQLLLRQHILKCPACQVECKLLAAVDHVPLEPQPGRIRQLIWATLAPLPHLALRGDIFWYQAPAIGIALSERGSSDVPRTWTLSGEARTPDGMQTTNTLTGAALRSIDDPEQMAYTVQADSDGGFVFRNLSAGIYRLSLFTADLEIVISPLRVGDD